MTRRSSRLQKIYDQQEESIQEKKVSKEESEQANSEFEESVDEQSDEASSFDSETPKQLTKRQQYLLDKKNNKVVDELTPFSIEKKKRKKIKKMTQNELQQKKIENEEKRKEHMKKNQKERLHGALERILNYKENSKSEKNDNDNKKDQSNFRKLPQKDHLLYRWCSTPEGDWMENVDKKIFELKIKKPIKNNCEICHQPAKYRTPIQYHYYCSVNCVREIKKKFFNQFFLIMLGITRNTLLPIGVICASNFSYQITESRLRYRHKKILEQYGDKFSLNEFHLTSPNMSLPYSDQFQINVERNALYGIQAQFEKLLQVGILASSIFSFTFSMCFSVIFFLHRQKVRLHIEMANKYPNKKVQCKIIRE